MKNNYIDSVFSRVSAESAHKTDTEAFFIDTLIKIQTDKGISEESAKAAADECIRAVLTYNSVVEDTKNDAEKTMTDFLGSLSKLRDEDRLMILNQVDFGLKAARKSSLLKELNEDTDLAEAVFDEENLSKDIEKAEASILNSIKKYGISKDTVELFTKEVKKKGNYFVCIEDFTRNDFYIKSLATMETYLQAEGQKTMLAAAGEVCTSVEVQAVADAVNQGVISREKAKKIIIALAVAAIIVVIISAVILAIETNTYGLLIEGAEQAATTAAETLSTLPYAETNLITQTFQNSVAEALLDRSAFMQMLKRLNITCIISALVAAAGGTAIKFSDKISETVSRWKFNKVTEKQKADSVASGMHAIADVYLSEAECAYVEQTDSIFEDATEDEVDDEYNINRSENFEFA